jgi:mannosyltransferase OCH1-like enzyme
VKWFEDNGHVVRELKELPSYDEVIGKSMDEYTEFRFGAAADIVRQVIIYDEGGLYLDIDAFIREWDNEWLHYFDSIYWKDVLKFDSLVVFTY